MSRSRRVPRSEGRGRKGIEGCHEVVVMLQREKVRIHRQPIIDSNVGQAASGGRHHLVRARKSPTSTTSPTVARALSGAREVRTAVSKEDL